MGGGTAANAAAAAAAKAASAMITFGIVEEGECCVSNLLLPCLSQSSITGCHDHRQVMRIGCFSGSD